MGPLVAAIALEELIAEVGVAGVIRVIEREFAAVRTAIRLLGDEFRGLNIIVHDLCIVLFLCGGVGIFDFSAELLGACLLRTGGALSASAGLGLFFVVIVVGS